ncbi:MAG: ABC transporter substrate-binding protein [Alphaproteobacteria bacterium]|nr:ABC transporter substrate-binding protein [Alphaproteobacteria bacterium]
MKSRVLAIATLAALAPAVAFGANVRIGLGGDPDVLDPAIGGSFLDRVVFAGLCDKLVDIDQNLNYVPQLAEEWAWSTDALTLTMKLRRDVTFHDGEKMDGASVKANIERSKTLAESRRKTELAAIKEVEADGPTVRFKLAQPFAPLIGVFTDRGGMVASPKALAAMGSTFATKPVCSGPYSFVERVALDRIVVKKFPQHWNQAAYKIEQVTYLPIPDSTVRTANLRSGGLQVIERVLPSDLAALESDARTKVVGSPATAYYTMSINLNHGERAATLGKDPRVREALELSLDREVINQVVYNGEFIASNQPWAPGSAWNNPGLPVPKRDVAKAKALLKAAGQEKLSFTLFAPNTTTEMQLAQVMQAMAAEAGIEIKIEVQEATTIVQRNLKGDYQAAFGIWSGRPDPDANVSIWFACQGFVNWGKYCNQKLEDVLDKARTVTATPERQKLYHQAAEIILADRPHLILYHYRWFWGLAARLDGFKPYPDGIVRLDGMTLAN